MKQIIDIENLLLDNGIDFRLSENGWLNTYCPFCYKGDGKMGLGIHTQTNATSCFRCGKMSLKTAILKILGKNAVEWPTTALKYRGYKRARDRDDRPFKGHLNAFLSVVLPYGTAELAESHKNYLKNRNFDPKQLVTEWGLQGTGNLGDFKHRIIIPIYQEGQLVNFTGRDITGVSKERYKSCPNEKAILPIKSCLYGLDDIENDSVIITEGPTKVWRLGKGNAVATFGTAVTNEQILLLSKFKRRIILFDRDDAGIKAADNLALQLSPLNGETIKITCNIIDIGNLSQQTAKDLVKKLLK